MKPGRKNVWPVLALALVCCGLVPLSGQDDGKNGISGVVTYLDGTVDVYRDGLEVPWHQIEIGFAIEEYDLVKCGEDGLAIVDFLLPSGATLVAHISSDTSFYVEPGAIGGRAQSRFGLLKGEIRLGVARLAYPGEVTVVTRYMAMGVRGTDFVATTAPEGSLLVTCTEGDVICFDSEGNNLLARPGTAVEQTDVDFRAIRVAPDTLDDFRREWREERERIFVAGAPQFIKAFAGQFIDYLPFFEKAMDKLEGEGEIFAVWAAQRTNDVEPDLGQLLIQRSRVTQAIVETRRVLPLFEQVFYRLSVMSRYHAAGIGETRITPTVRSDSFFDDFDRRAPQLELELALARHYLKLYGWAGRQTGIDLIDDVFSGTGSPVD